MRSYKWIVGPVQAVVLASLLNACQGSVTVTETVVPIHTTSGQASLPPTDVTPATPPDNGLGMGDGSTTALDGPTAKLRIAYIDAYSPYDAVDVCFHRLGADKPNIPVYRSLGATDDPTTGGVPRYKVGRYFDAKAGQYSVKVVPANAGCDGSTIFTNFTVSLDGGTTTTQVFNTGALAQNVDTLAPVAGTEQARLFDFSSDLYYGNHATTYRHGASGEDVDDAMANASNAPKYAALQPALPGNFVVQLGGNPGHPDIVRKSADHTTRDGAVTTAFAWTPQGSDTTAMIVCDDLAKGDGVLSSCE